MFSFPFPVYFKFNDEHLMGSSERKGMTFFGCPLRFSELTGAGARGVSQKQGSGPHRRRKRTLGFPFYLAVPTWHLGQH